MWMNAINRAWSEWMWWETRAASKTRVVRRIGISIWYVRRFTPDTVRLVVAFVVDTRGNAIEFRFNYFISILCEHIDNKQCRAHYRAQAQLCAKRRQKCERSGMCTTVPDESALSINLLFVFFVFLVFSFTPTTPYSRLKWNSFRDQLLLP